MSDESEEERQPVPFDDAVGALPAKPRIHTFRNPGASVLVGADWDRESVVRLIRRHGAELAGKAARHMGHGLVVIDDEGALFIETQKDKP